MTLMLEPQACHKIAEELNQLLADTYVLYLKTQNFHWNVVDPRFSELHKLFEDQYTELSKMVDEVAERIRMLGEKSSGTMKQFLQMTTLDEAPSNLTGDEMMKHLAVDHQSISKWLRERISKTQVLGDEGTADILIQHLKAHDKAAWMLMSHLKERA